MTGGTFSGHDAVCSFGRLSGLVKNADENWPSAPDTFYEVIATAPAGNRDDSRISATD
ncbi:hypothetical protein [Streptomyces sp. NPDC098781]|uniref:hypothetical protein n=1 Tax=Streptomyces sp. NPDC098781 TaxID=3366097 RepID=UPI0037F74976